MSAPREESLKPAYFLDLTAIGAATRIDAARRRGRRRELRGATRVG
jgi:hypothetical protein